MSTTRDPQSRSDQEEQGRGEQGPDPQGQSAGTGARPEEILRDGIEGGANSDEEAVLAYNANAEDGDPEPDGAGEE